MPESGSVPVVKCLEYIAKCLEEGTMSTVQVAYVGPSEGLKAMGPLQGYEIARADSLRDKFAMVALQGLLACCANEDKFPAQKMIAKRAYEYADAMLKARESKEG